jgi:predicted ATPase
MTLKTLGKLALEGKTFGRVKPLVLLCYLALEGKKSRQFLADLFWPESTNPRAGLSSALYKLHQALGDKVASDTDFVWTTISSDAKLLTGLLDQGQVDKALESYQGPFLDSVYIKECGLELEEWLYVTRELLAQRLQTSLLQKAEETAKAEAFVQAAKYAEAAYLLRGAPAPDPDILERLYTVLCAGDNVLSSQIKKDAEGYGVTLSLSLQEAQASFRFSPETRATSPTADPTLGQHFPSQNTSFVGRKAELAHLTALLTSENRLFTLTGIGGIGKTRLALELGRNAQETFVDGVHFVALAPVTSGELVVAAIGKSLGLSFHGGTELETQLFEELRTKHALLILDNFEHLVDAATFAARLLQHCAKLKLLVTSRERLNLAGESVVPLSGLRLGADALELFRQRARLAKPEVTLTKEDQAYAVTICHLLDGLPLGIELAASWVRVMPPRDIAIELESSLDLLSQNTRDAPERHQSLRAIFEHSWTLLSAKEQELYRKLAVFRGGFSKDAAAEVAGVPVTGLATFVDKSLLRFVGRYERHPLLYQYALEKLAEYPEEETHTKARHGRYYLDFLNSRSEEMRGSQQTEACEAVEADLENIRLAWHWAVTGQKTDNMIDAVRGLRRFFELRGRLAEGAQMFGEAASSLREKKHTHRAALGYLWAGRAWCHSRLGYGDTAIDDLSQKSLALLGPSGDLEGKMWALSALGFSARYQGDYELAKQHAVTMLELARVQGDSRVVADCLSDSSGIEQLRGNYKAALAYVSEALQLYQGLQDYGGECWSLGFMGLLTLRLGNLDEAEALLHQALKLAEESKGQRWRTLYQSASLHTGAGPPKEEQPCKILFITHLGLVAAERGDYQQARQNVSTALKMIQEMQEPWLEALILSDLGRIELALDHDNVALGYFLQSLNFSKNLHWFMPALTALVGVAELRKRQGKLEQAAELASLVLHHSATEHVHRTHAQKLLKNSGLSKQHLETAVERGRKLVLEQVRGELLHHNERIKSA